MNRRALRAAVFTDLKHLGFRPSRGLPGPEPVKVRPVREIVTRLMALDALFVWVAYKATNAPTASLTAYLARNELRSALTLSENESLDVPRTAAKRAHVDTIGWKLENMWPLAWVLGFSPAPGLAASQIGGKVLDSLLDDFMPGMAATVADFEARCRLRPADEIAAMEYRFYCAHNAVRSAQLGGNTVPKRFHPVIHGGAIHERRHSLTWCVSPGVAWDDTDLST